ncbi:MAG TPA: serine/threonine protein kinase [Planctomycetes bacterium]|nr:serine/threonine protein kinase [Planctomycetota bacterium]
MEIRDGLFGTVVVKLGLCASADIQAALELQERYKNAQKRVPRLGEILASQGKVGAEQVQAILSGSLNAKPGRRFGEICAELHFVDRDGIVGALKEQKAAAAKGSSVAIGQIMVEKGMLRPEQVRTVLRAQGIEARHCPICRKIYNVPAGMADDFNDCPTCTGPLFLLEDEKAEAPSGGEEVVPVSEPLPDLPHQVQTAESQPAPDAGPAAQDAKVSDKPLVDTKSLTRDMAAPEAHQPQPPPVVAPPSPAPAAAAKAEPPPQQLAGVEPGAVVRQPEGPPEDLPMLLPDEDDEAADMYGRFKVVKVIGEDGKSVLYEAEDTADGQRVALRVFSDVLGKPYLDEVKREFNVARQVASEYLKRPLEIGHEDGFLYIAEEFVRGKSLREMFKAGHIPLRVMTGVIQQIVTLIRECHAKGIIHMGLRPSQIILTPAGRVKVGGFGYPKDAVDDMRRIVEVSGEVPVYAGPELAVDGLPRDHRADIYSIGAIYYHGVTGKPPYSGGSVGELLLRISTEDVAPAHMVNPRVPETVSAVIGKMLAIDPSERYFTIDEAAQAIADVSGLESGVAPAEELAYPEQDAQPEGMRPSSRVHAKAVSRARRRTASKTARTSRRNVPATQSKRQSRGSRQMQAANRSPLVFGMILVGVVVGAIIGVAIWFLMKARGA